MLLRFLEKLEEGAISLLLVTMTLLVFVEVILRFFFGTGVLWAQEATLHLSAWLVLFGMSYGVKKGAHIGVDVLVASLPMAGKKIAGLIAVAGSLAYAVLLGYGGWVYLSKVRMIGIELEDLPIQKWQAHSILFIGMVLLGWRCLELGWRTIKGEAHGFAFADEAKEALHELEEHEKEEQRKDGER